MNTTTLCRNLLFCVSYIVLFNLGYSQLTCDHPLDRTWIRIEDAHHNVDTLWFGIAQGGTCSFDSALCEGWIDGPCRTPEDTFCPSWISCDRNFPLYRFNYQGIKSPGQIDTFDLGLNVHDAYAQYPFKLSWSSSGVSAIFDSAIIQDLLSRHFSYARMGVQESLLVSSIFVGRLVIYGCGSTIATVPEGNHPFPVETRLYQNYPNPFNPITSIPYTLQRSERVTVTIFDIFGRVVQNLVDRIEGPGNHIVTWNSNGVSSGVYLYRLLAENHLETKRLMVLR